MIFVIGVRLTKPKNNPYYNRIMDGGYNQAFRGYPTDPTATVLSNCVGYANGRFAEVQDLDRIEYQFTCDAENLIEHAKKFGLKVQKKPVKWGLIVWKCGDIYSGSDGHGHVAFVERDESEMGEGVIFTSESTYAGVPFYNETRSNADGNWGMSSKYQYLGCIVNPAIDKNKQERPRYKATKGMPVRIAPYSGAPKVTTVPKGNVHTALSGKSKKNAFWIKVKHKGKTGWTCVRYKNDIYWNVKD